MIQGEEETEMKDIEISSAIRKVGMFYFEYDPVKHMAVRPENIEEGGMSRQVENFPDSIVHKIVKDQKQAETFLQAFRKMDEGSSHEVFEVEVEMQGRLYWYQYNLVATDEGTVICIASNISELHTEHVMERLILRKQFEAICMIDVETGKYAIRFMNWNEDTDDQILDDYEKGSRVSAEKFVVKEERASFLQRCSIKVIKEQLEEKKEYQFMVTGLDAEGNEQCYEYRYHFVDDTHRVILATLENVTSIMDHDLLTGEYNRNGFIRYVSEFLKQCEDRTRYAMLFFNIKGFKAINEILGIESGDQVLKESTELLRTSFLEPIALCRLEADHFVLLIDKKNLDYEKLGELCQRSLNTKGKSFRYYGRCGVYPLNERVHSVSGMIDRAKLAKQFILDDYIQPYAVYDQTMRDSFVQTKKLLSDLEQALENHEFEVYFQPIYDAVTEEIASAEALVRWIHPENGIVPPNEFIPAFEENGHISQLDMFVEESSKNFIVERLTKKKRMVPVAINLSRMDFYDTKFMNKIVKDVEEIRNLDEFCRLEITESAYSQLLDNAANYIRRFKEAGVKILLDDFGSGFSSFSTISQFDFDILKLDIGFTRKIGENRKVELIIKNIINMAHDLDIKVIAEGVETEAQRDFLKASGCDYLQGFYYSKAIPRQAFELLLDAE